ncbi:MAG: aldehyde ferredoxin oxidoreductase family protein [Deltaproteobacteria bacterium]|nr:aldehyde ferredoxin oxidoreductase family protein [Deltaproteobacteria bacterium]
MPKGETSSGGRGFCDKICTVDLTARKIEYEQLGEDFYRKFLGGVGLGAKILWDRMKPGADPLGPENILGFTTGLLTDTGSLFTGRFTVVGKSPASGGWGDANCGGYFSPFLKRCGIDALFFTGASEQPIYLLIDENNAEIKDASDLWGKDTIETERVLRDRHGQGAQVACIGPAGERLSRIAGICNDYGRMAARSGLGAVMGSKKLKAVVAVGRRKVGVANAANMKELTAKYRRRIKDPAFTAKLFNDRVMALFGWLAAKGLFNKQLAFVWRWLLRGFGTPSLVAMCAQNGDSPTKNWGGAAHPDFPFAKHSKVGMDRIRAYETRKYGCYSCPIRCGGHVTVTDGPHKIEKMHKPEYETICAFANMTVNDDLHSIFHINDLVNRGGIDSISCGAVVSFAIECFENGVLTKADTGGLELKWGDSQAVIELTRTIINREGIGDVLADGVKLAAEKIGRGAGRFAVHCGGIEAPMHDPKFDPGWGFTYYLEPTPGRHTISCNQYLAMQPVKKQFKSAIKRVPAVAEKTKHVKHARQVSVGSHYKMLVDCAGVCLFGTQAGGNMPLCEWLNAATGWNLSHEDYLEIGERVGQLRHAFNVREGLNPMRDFRPHGRIFGDPPLASGPLKNRSLPIDDMAKAYYAVNGWRLEDAMPDPERLRRLGLADVVESLGG